MPWIAIILGAAPQMNPKVSLILTVHNREQYLEEAIASVLSQTYPDYELILWDDGSGDRTGEIAAHLSQQDPRIKYESRIQR
jgi:glycosyltransferase involved in cell wall biosynthesis